MKLKTKMQKTLNIIIIAIIIATSVMACASTEQSTVNKLTQASAATFDNFITETFLPRAQLEYAGRFTDPADAKKISTSAKTAVNSLKDILHLQQMTSQRIEEYDGDDWDDLYGKTSLWRNSVTAARQTSWRICIVNYHHALASTGDQKETLLKNVLDQTGDDSGFSINERNFLRTQAKWAIAPEKNIDITICRLDSLIASSGIDNEVFYQAVIMRMKMSGRTNPQQLEALAESLNKSKLKNNFELLFKLAIEELKAGSDNLINTIAAKHPAAIDIAGQLVLHDIASTASNPQLLSITIKTKTPAQARLAALTASKKQNSKYAEIFEQMVIVEKFQSNAVYLAAAVSCRQTQPVKAVAYYLTSAEKSIIAKDNLIDMTSADIARQGARLAYDLYYKDSKHFPVAKNAIERYLTIADKNPDDELSYLYASMLIESDESDKATDLLKSIIAKNGKYANAAGFDMIFYAAKKTTPHSTQRKELIIKLNNFINKQDATNNDSLNINKLAVALYCKLLLQEGGKDNAIAVLNILENIPYEHTPDIAVIKAAALAENGDMVNAATTLATAIENGDPNGSPLLAASLTSEILEDIDEYEDKTENFAEFIKICSTLAHHSNNSITDESQNKDYQKKLIELNIITTQENGNTAKVGEYLLNEYTKKHDDDIDILRCTARLYMKQDRFAEAFKIWTSIAQTRKPPSHAAAKPSKWWRAKYYALKCYSKMPDKINDDLHRAIEILISTNKNIPKFWKKKLTELKTTISD